MVNTSEMGTVVIQERLATLYARLMSEGKIDEARGVLTSALVLGIDAMEFIELSRTLQGEV